MKHILILFCFCCAPAYADLNIDAINVTENFNETVKVSGKFHMGIQYSGKHDFDSLYVDIPENTNGMLCIKLASINGVYKAQLEHPITAQTSGRTKINFPSKYKNEISSLRENELSLLTTVGKNCESKKHTFLMAGCSEDSNKSDPILIIRSGARIDIANVPSIEHSVYSFKCKKFKDTSSITFDKYCRLTGVSVDDLSSVEVYRKNFRELSSKKIVLLQ